MSERDPELGERYVLLALRLARHDEGVVETYYGPPDLAARRRRRADRPRLPSWWPRPTDCSTSSTTAGSATRSPAFAPARAWSPARAGATADEVAACFGVEPTRTDEAALHAAYDELEQLLPGQGPLRERYQDWERATQVPADRVPALVGAVVEESRGQARRLFGLPDGEGFDVEYVRGESWMAFHEYAGGLRATVSVNVDLQRSAVDLLHTVLHETYAGHHAEACLKEVGLVRERGLLEQTIVVVPTPQSLLSEGLAEVGPSLLVDGDERPAYQAILSEAGVDTDLDRDRAVAAAVEPVIRIGADAARLIHQEGRSEEEVRQYLAALGPRRPRAHRARPGVRDRPDVTRLHQLLPRGSDPLPPVRRRRRRAVPDAAHPAAPRA